MGIVRGDVWGIGLVAAGLLVAVLSVAMWLMLLSVRLDVEVATLRVRRLGGETALRARARFGHAGRRCAARMRRACDRASEHWAGRLGRARLRGNETIELVPHGAHRHR